MTSRVYRLASAYALHNGDSHKGIAYLFNIESGKVYKLNGVSYTMLASFDGKKTTEQILSELLARYRAEPQRIQADFKSLTETWVNGRILEERR